MYRSFTLSFLTASDLLSIGYYFCDWEGTCLFYSGGDSDAAGSCFLGLFPFESVEVSGLQLTLDKGNQKESLHVANPWNGLQEHFFDSLSDTPQAIAFGWFGYGLGAFADADVRLNYRPASTPDAYWQKCAVTLRLDLKTAQAYIQIDLSALPFVKEEEKKWTEQFLTPEGWRDFIATLPKQPIKYQYTERVSKIGILTRRLLEIFCLERMTIASGKARVKTKILMQSRQRQKPIFESRSVYLSTPLFSLDEEKKENYLKQVRSAQELILAGEIYQVNLSHQFNMVADRSPFSLFRQICEINPAPFSLYFNHGGIRIISTSPERFLSKKGEALETRPIKGTMRRGKNSEEDQLLKQQLLNSPKEKGELLMITDLMRNDLGKISQVGSVKVKELWRCESYSNVFHLLSIISSLAKPGLSPLEIVRSCFPGGSITGCPKLRAMEVIDAFEDTPRGIYTGSIGYFTGNGDFDLNIAIRTLVEKNQQFSLRLGSGIVIDSVPEHEYEETLAKGDSIFKILNSCEV